LSGSGVEAVLANHLLLLDEMEWELLDWAEDISPIPFCCAAFDVHLELL